MQMEMRKLAALLVGLPFSTLALSATTWTVTGPTWELDGNGKTYQSQGACVAAAEAMAAAIYHCTNSNVATVTGTVTAGPPPPPVPPPPTAGTYWVYQNGTFNWPGDWSWSGRANYRDTTGDPLSGGYDIAFTLLGSWGGWLPYAPNKRFSLTPYKYLTIAIKTTVAPQPVHIFFEAANDTPVGTFIDPAASGYGQTPVVGQWNTYRIPLAAFGVTGVDILKFGVQDDSGGANNTLYIDNVGFTN
jgi:hypothetical protein